MFKIFKVTYNDGGWHTGSLPHFFYIAENEDDVIKHSKRYKDFLEQRDFGGGDIWITEMAGLYGTWDFENLEDFDISISAKEKED